MKLYENEEAEAPAESENGHEERQDYSELFGAPDYATFIKTNISAKSKQYERRVASLVKAGVIGTINAKDYPDAAALLKYGPPFCRAAGELANVDKRAQALIDMVTSPDNPYAMFVAAAIPLVGQLFRNHGSEIQQVAMSRRQRRAQKRAARAAGLTIPKPESRPIGHIKIGKRSIPIKIGVQIPKFFSHFKMSLMLQAQTSDPRSLVNEVFSDPKVIDALRKMGARPEQERQEQPSFDDLDEMDDE